jgi:hypothetical protein
VPAAGSDRDQRWADALAELLDDPKRAQAAARDPRAYARKLGVKLPRDLVVDLRVVAGRPDLTVTGLDPLAPFEFHWTEDGFTSQAGAEAAQAPPQDQPRRSGTVASRKRPTPRRSPLKAGFLHMPYTGTVLEHWHRATGASPTCMSPRSGERSDQRGCDGSASTGRSLSCARLPKCTKRSRDGLARDRNHCDRW